VVHIVTGAADGVLQRHGDRAGLGRDPQSIDCRRDTNHAGPPNCRPGHCVCGRDTAQLYGLLCSLCALIPGGCPPDIGVAGLNSSLHMNVIKCFYLRKRILIRDVCPVVN
jgi:hypothetical protein